MQSSPELEYLALQGVRRMVRRLAFPAPPPRMVWSGTGWGGGGGWRVRRGVGAVGAAAGETARRHRPGQHSTQALRKP